MTDEILELAKAIKRLNKRIRVLETGEGTQYGATIITGTYTGDGAASNGITGVGGTPEYLKIITIVTDGNNAETFETTTDLVAEDPQGLALVDIGTNILCYDNRIISLDSDGFTVGDDGADEHPNKIGQDYAYVAII